MTHGLNAALERTLPERRLFLKSDTQTRFIRLRPLHQAAALAGSALLLGWTALASSLLIMDSIGSGSVREQALREQGVYEERLNALSSERDLRAQEAATAQARFGFALERVSDMQSQLLASEQRRTELETGIDVIQATLRRVVGERDGARGEVLALAAQSEAATHAVQSHDTAATVDFLSAALADTSGERDRLASEAGQARADFATLALDKRLMEERTDRILAQLEEAVSVSMEPLDKVFRAAGLKPERVLSQIRRGYAGQGGPLSPISYSTKGEISDAVTDRTNGILGSLDEMQIYRLALEKVPLANPLNTAYRFTSGFGGRSDPFGRGRRAHTGVDFAGRHGSPILATADGVVVKAGWATGYGQMVQIRHDFGLETLYAHMSRINVKPGQKVSRGTTIGAMGSTGRSTGTHLHYEVRVDGRPVNPMTYIMAAKNVF